MVSTYFVYLVFGLDNAQSIHGLDTLDYEHLNDY